MTTEREQRSAEYAAGKVKSQKAKRERVIQAINDYCLKCEDRNGKCTMKLWEKPCQLYALKHSKQGLLTIPYSFCSDCLSADRNNIRGECQNWYSCTLYNFRSF
jgi:hypothetical protein